MLQQQESSNKLEVLLGSLIKMLGKSNERMDNLDKRVQQLEWVMREMHITTQEAGGQRLYACLSRRTNK